MGRKRLWKQALAVTLSATMLLSVPSEVVFASNETNEEVSAEATESVETTESTEELEAATEANEIVTETETEEVAETEGVTEISDTEESEIESVEGMEVAAETEEVEETEAVAETKEFEVTSEEKTATAAEYFEYKDNENDDGEADGTVTITGYTGSDTEVVIPEQIDGKSVTGIGYAAFRGCVSLTSIEIPNSVTSIGDDIFWDCDNLISIVVGEENTTYTSAESNCIIEKSSNTVVTADEAVAVGLFFLGKVL